MDAGREGAFHISPSHSPGSQSSNLLASFCDLPKIARLGPKTNIFGISTNGELLTLWNDSGNVRSVTIPELGLDRVQALGGLDDQWGHGVFVANTSVDGYYLEVYNVWWDGGWKKVSIDDIMIETPYELSPGEFIGGGFIRFGSYKGETYVLYEQMTPLCHDGDNHFIKKMKFVGGTWRYDGETLNSQAFRRRRLC